MIQGHIQREMGNEYISIFVGDFLLLLYLYMIFVEFKTAGGYKRGSNIYRYGILTDRQDMGGSKI